MRTSVCVAVAMLCAAAITCSAQYVREYNPGSGVNLSFNCIAKAADGNCFIAGLQTTGKDTAVYVAEVTGTSAVVREKLVDLTITNSKAYTLNSMIVDADGNIVIVGLISPAGKPTKAFLMKLSPALSVLLHVSYTNKTTPTEAMAFTDVKDYKTSTANNAYYVSGYNIGTKTGQDAVLMKLDRTTGTVITEFDGQPLATSTSDMYDALLLDTTGTAAATPSVYTTGRLSSGAASTFRPWLAAHNIGTLAFTRAKRYIADVTQTQRLFASGISRDAPNTSMLYCWYGNVTGTGYPKVVGLSSVNFNTLAPVFEWQYGITPTFQNFTLLTKVETDPNGYVVHGQWWDSISTQGEIFLIRADKHGIPLWARQYKNVLNDVTPHNSSFIIDGPSIYAIGYKIVSGVKRGVLIKTDVATGAMDTACAKILVIKTSSYSFSATDSVKKIDLAVAEANDYYPVNCIATDSAKPCDTCIGKLSCNPNFTLTSQLVTGDTTFKVTVSAYSTACNSVFVVSKVNPNPPYADVAGTMLSVPAWGTGATSVFPGYQGTGVAGTNTTGIFAAGTIYRVRHIVSGTNNCGVSVSDTSSQLVLQVSGLMAPKPPKIIIFDEKDIALHLAEFASIKPAGIINLTPVKTAETPAIYPNPANQSVTFSSAAPQQGQVLRIYDGSGRVIQTINLGNARQLTVNTAAWANGLYLYSVTGNGRPVLQGKFVVQH